MNEKKIAFYKKLEELDVYNNETFDFDDHNLIIQKIYSEGLKFNNCIFNCNSISFKYIQNQATSIEFNNCTFNCNVSFNNCKLDTLKFLNTKNIKSLKVNGSLSNFEEKSEIKSFYFSNTLENEKNESENTNEIVLSVAFSFNNVLFKKYFEFNHINNSKGIFSFSNNIIGDELNIANRSCVFHSSNISSLKFNDNVFNSYTSFKNSTFSFNKDNFKNTGSHWNQSKFERNEFNKVNFSEIEIVDYIEFDDCKFHSTTWFENCKNIYASEVKFTACKFEKYSLFDNSKFNKIKILHSNFLEKASFENIEINHFKIHQVTFTGAAYFDDLNKTNDSAIEKWDRKTLRAIKRELVNTHNQIDYLRFKAYELEAFKKEKNKSWKDNAILKLNSFSSKNGLDWFRGLLFTTITGFMFYLLYLCTYAIVMKNTLHFPNSIEDFWVGYLKFLNPFSLFKSPIEDAETYFFPLFSFMLGKIFISYGIFQTVQAFRKFGVNGG